MPSNLGEYGGTIAIMEVVPPAAHGLVHLGHYYRQRHEPASLVGQLSCAGFDLLYGFPALLEDLINAFSFKIQGQHADNGSEYINYQVAEMLNKLRVTEFTKSRAQQSTGNALVESKNAAVVRKHLGYGHIPAHCARALNDFNQNVLSLYLNFHRPCLFAKE
ncbi:MAG TPA: hypothetical protein VK110_04295 [Salinisphaeraceae bacterium]|nr:hypothetical protein [Salinisphaeraceae bacterium]